MTAEILSLVVAGSCVVSGRCAAEDCSDVLCCFVDLPQCHLLLLSWVTWEVLLAVADLLVLWP